jgi:hypothetical protein
VPDRLARRLQGKWRFYDPATELRTLLVHFDPKLTMKINDPQVLADVTAAFNAYEQALVSNDVETLDALFWQSPLTIRYGAGENLYGIDEIKAFRLARPSTGLERSLQRTVITTYGDSHATAMTEFMRPGFVVDGKPVTVGRQSQTWVKTEEPGYGGWRVVAAHVSLLKLPA